MAGQVVRHGLERRRRPRGRLARAASVRSEFRRPAVQPRAAPVGLVAAQAHHRRWRHRGRRGDRRRPRRGRVDGPPATRFGHAERPAGRHHTRSERRITTAAPASDGRVIAGDVLWTASSGAGPLGIQAQNLPGGQRVLVTPERRDRGAAEPEPQGRRAERRPASSCGRSRWSPRTRRCGCGAMACWSPMAPGSTLYDLATGKQRFRVPPVGPRDRRLSVRATASCGSPAIALNSTTAFIGLGSAMLAINRAGNARQRVQVGDRLAQTPETPTAASTTWVVTQTVGLQSFGQPLSGRAVNRPWFSQPYTPLRLHIDGWRPRAGADATIRRLRFVEARIVGGYRRRAESKRTCGHLRIAGRQRAHGTRLSPTRSTRSRRSTRRSSSPRRRLTKYDIVQRQPSSGRLRLPADSTRRAKSAESAHRRSSRRPPAALSDWRRTDALCGTAHLPVSLASSDADRRHRRTARRLRHVPAAGRIAGRSRPTSWRSRSTTRRTASDVRRRGAARLTAARRVPPWSAGRAEPT